MRDRRVQVQPREEQIGGAAMGRRWHGRMGEENVTGCRCSRGRNGGQAHALSVVLVAGLLTMERILNNPESTADSFSKLPVLMNSAGAGSSPLTEESS